MRKQNTGITVVLVILVAISFLFSYFILYDINTFESIIGNESALTEEEIATETIQSTANYSSPAIKFFKMLSLQMVYYRLGQRCCFIHDEATINTLRSLMKVDHLS